MGRPTCPRCGDALAEGRCPAHGAPPTAAFWTNDDVPSEAVTAELAAPGAAVFDPGDRFAAYTVRHVLGTGGQGTVYACADASGKLWAVKVLARTASPEVLEREAALLASVTHPNVLRPSTTGRLPDGSAYLAMEHLSGRPLSRLGRLPWSAFRPLLGQALSALAAIHAVGLVHRDVKPDNLMVSDDGHTLTLIDFGTARTGDGPIPPTTPTLVRGTLEYMSPEQLTGKPVDGRTDLFSLGCVGYEVLTGALPWPGNAAESARRRVQEEARPLGRIPGLGARDGGLIRQLVARDPAARPASAQAAHAALGATVAGPT